MEPNLLQRPEPWSRYLLTLIAPAVVLGGNLTGGIAGAGGVVLLAGVYPILDIFLGSSPRPRSVRASGDRLIFLLYFLVLLQVVCVGSLCWRAGQDGARWTTWVAAFSTGVVSGANGMIVAHELGHRRPRSLGWWLARLNLLSVLYLHFTHEHNHTHHRKVATLEDPASAPRGRSLWSHIVRTVPGQLASAWRVQQKRGRSGLRNPVARELALQAFFLGVLWVACSPWVALAVIGQASVSVLMLEYVNYIRHYGLRREPDEKQTVAHSWQTDARWSRWTLLELPRHPAHHLRAHLPFWKLHPCAGAPELPAGYFALFWVCVFPFLWRRWMGPVIQSMDEGATEPVAG